MTDLDAILEREKHRVYQLESPELIAFATLTQIAHEQARQRIRRRFGIGIAVCLIAGLAVVQLLALNQISVLGVSNTLAMLLSDYSYAITFVNLSLVALVLLAKKIHLI